MKIFKSALFWILFSGVFLAGALFLLLQLLHAGSLGGRFLWASIPLAAAALAALILSIIRLKRALKSQESAQANPFEMDMAVKPWLEPLKAETKNALANWGLAAVGYLVVGRILERIIRP